MKRVTGIGGIFFQSDSPAQLYEWYEKHLGIKRDAHGQGASFEWRELQAPDGSTPGNPRPGSKAKSSWLIGTARLFRDRRTDARRRNRP